MKTNLAMQLYKYSRYFYTKKAIFLSKIFASLNRIICACQIPPSASLSPTTYLLHNGLGVVIHEKAAIGNNVVICQNVTIGGGRGGAHPGGAATILDGAVIGAGAVLLGPITIGENARIGANAVVLEDVPDNATATGIPAKIYTVTGKYGER